MHLSSLCNHILMTSENDLSHQPDTLQKQPALKKKKNNIIWIVTVTSLLIANLQYLHFLYSWSNRLGFDSLAFSMQFCGTTPHLSALLAIDLVTASFFFSKNTNTYWKVLFILLF